MADDQKPRWPPGSGDSQKQPARHPKWPGSSGAGKSGPVPAAAKTGPIPVGARTAPMPAAAKSGAHEAARPGSARRRPPSAEDVRRWRQNILAGAGTLLVFVAIIVVQRLPARHYPDISVRLDGLADIPVLAGLSSNQVVAGLPPGTTVELVGEGLASSGALRYCVLYQGDDNLLHTGWVEQGTIAPAVALRILKLPTEPSSRSPQPTEAPRQAPSEAPESPGT